MVDSSRIRLGIVGCGRVAEQCHLPAALTSERVELAAVVDSSPARLEQVVSALGLSCHVATSTADVDGRVDAVLLSLPNHLHCPVASDYLRAGVHVLCEKPLANTVRDARAMCELAEERRLILGVGYMKRFEPNFLLMIRLIEDKLLGTLLRFEFEFGSAGGWAPVSGYNLSRESAGGGVLTSNGAHWLDRMLCWFGNPSQVAYRDDARGGVEANCIASFAFCSGLTGQLTLSKTHALRNRFRLYGERGCIEIGGAQQESVTFLPMGRGGVKHEISEHPVRRPLTDLDYFRLQLDDFARAVQQGVPPRAPAREALRTVELIEHCYQIRTPLVQSWAPDLTISPGGGRNERAALADRSAVEERAPVTVPVRLASGGAIERQRDAELPTKASARAKVRDGDRDVFVTGSTGLVGSRLCEVLHLRGDRRPRPFLRSSGTGSYIARYPLDLRLGDLTDLDAVRRGIEGCASVVHLARGSQRVMIEGLKNVLRAAVEAKVERFVHVSSVAVCGDSVCASGSDRARTRKTGSPYGDIKLEQERLVASYGRRFGLRFVILRPPLICGPYSHFVYAMIERLRAGALPIVDGGTNICNLVYIDNLVEALVLSLERTEAVGETFFITDREPITWRKCVQDFANLLNVDVPHVTSEQLQSRARRSVAGSLRRMSRILLSQEFRSAAMEIPALEVVGKLVVNAGDALPKEFRNRLRRRLHAGAPHGTPVVSSTYDPDDYLITAQRRTAVFQSEKAARLIGYTGPVAYNEGLLATSDWMRSVGLLGDPSEPGDNADEAWVAERLLERQRPLAAASETAPGCR